MIKIQLSIDDKHLPVIEQFLASALAEVQKARNPAYMPEVCCKKTTAYFDTVQKLAKAAMERVTLGTPIDDAVAEMTRQAPYPAWDTALANLRLAMKKRDRETRLKRDALIERMLQAGYRNRQIAEAIGSDEKFAAKLAAAAKSRIMKETRPCTGS
ncbi:hypothetical protein A6A04_08940 [Paramagnetospirillum marisnigri]|uniref:Uncharacterized protein n=1 Tax=Paramagnetospirillum marisnigri TaxID=1285242 RepID=A0A178M701_9PROT|nr:hypothetical protein [Paramagnetospirillum marisnigri]OAN43997.1 hypothetical protein A6A04_08940 [Paramagnetospirillum marisnigri]